MKKLIAFLLVIVTCFSFFACDKKDEKSKGETSTKKSTVINSKKTTEKDSTSADSSDKSTSSSSKTKSSTAAKAANATKATTTKVTTTARQTVNVTIPEGFCVSQIGDKLQANGVCTKAAFLSVINTYNFKESCVSQIQYNSSTMCYRLEGYLYPETYTFYKNMKPEDVVGKMLRVSDNRIYGKYDFKTVVLASILEKEVRNDNESDLKNASSVFHNRLNNPQQFAYIGSEATVYYLTTYLAQIDKEMNSNLVDTYKQYYNTDRRVKGLPAGPICSPSAQALDAAANPYSTNYYYFKYDSATKTTTFYETNPDTTTTTAAAG